ncbi:MAG: hypothetical protein JXR88_05040 [Clostridia bacterium]|nr:hypothetical protein [Clostridia bacterium]
MNKLKKIHLLVIVLPLTLGLIFYLSQYHITMEALENVLKEQLKVEDIHLQSLEITSYQWL